MLIAALHISDHPRRLITQEDLERAEEEHRCLKEQLRAKTAPTKVHRKNWLAGSLQIKTAEGEKVKVKAPGIDNYIHWACCMITTFLLTYSCLRNTIEIVWIYDTFDVNFIIKNDFSKDLKRGCW